MQEHHYHKDGSLSVISYDAENKDTRVTDNMEFTVYYKGENEMLKQLDGIGGTSCRTTAFLRYTDGKLHIGDYIGGESIVVQYNQYMNSIYSIINRLNALLHDEVYTVEKYSGFFSYHAGDNPIEVNVGVFGQMDLMEVLND